MKRNFKISLLLSILFALNALAQFDIEKTEKELKVRSPYTIIENKDGHIFAGTWGAGIWKSTDFGNTWNRVSEGLQSYDIRKLTALNDRIFVATAVGLYYTDDGSLNWIPVNELDEKASYRNIVINENSIYVATDDGKIYKSQNGGLAWSQTGKIDEPLITMPIIISNNKMLVGAESGLFISEDEGKTWLKSNNEINETIKDLSLIDETVYITTLSKGIFVSTDYGNSISKFATVKKQVYSNIPITSSVEFISSNRDGKVAAITNNGEVFVSNDDGMNWAVGSRLILAVPNTRFVELKAPDVSMKSYIPSPNFFEKRLNKKNETKINVIYLEDSPSQLRAAFEYAVAIWESIISSPVEINVHVTYAPGTTGYLATGGPGTTYSSFNNQPLQNTFFPVTLAEKFYGDDLNLPSEPDMRIYINSDYLHQFYFGIDGNPAPNQYDFVSLALHEICHGLGYTDGFNYNEGIGYWIRQHPYISDRFLFNGSNQALTDTFLFPTLSKELGDQLTSDNIYWNGPNITGVKMYAPATFSASSIAHLDYETYGFYYTGTGANSLMAPFIPQGVATHMPGDIVLRQMADMGWGTEALIADSNIEVSSTNINFGEVDFRSSAQQTISITNNTSTSFVISSFSIIGAGFSLPNGEKTIAIDPGNSYDLVVQFSPIDYRFYNGTLILTYNETGSHSYISLTGNCIYIGNEFLLHNTPNPVRSGNDAIIRYILRYGDEDIKLTVYDILGREVVKLVDEFQPLGVYSIRFNTKNLASGVYFYKLLMSNSREYIKKMMIIK